MLSLATRTYVLAASKATTKVERMSTSLWSDDELEWDLLVQLKYIVIFALCFYALYYLP